MRHQSALTVCVIEQLPPRLICCEWRLPLSSFTGVPAHCLTCPFDSIKRFADEVSGAGQKQLTLSWQNGFHHSVRITPLICLLHASEEQANQWRLFPLLSGSRNYWNEMRRLKPLAVLFFFFPLSPRSTLFEVERWERLFYFRMFYFLLRRNNWCLWNLCFQSSRGGTSPLNSPWSTAVSFKLN